MKCEARFIIEPLSLKAQDERMRCDRPHGHKGRHANRDGSIIWQTGAEVSLRAILGEVP